MTDNTALAQELGPWECFRDDSYYDMWCVRCVHDRTFGHGFHLVQGDEAAALRDLLNTYTPAPALDEVRSIVQTLCDALTHHHQWHAARTTPDPEHGFIPADEYADSALYECTVEALHIASRLLEPNPNKAATAPVSDSETPSDDQQPTAQPSDLVERVARAIGAEAYDDDFDGLHEEYRRNCRRFARAAIAAMQGGDAVLAERERCAKIAEAIPTDWRDGTQPGPLSAYRHACREIAAAIRGGA